MYGCIAKIISNSLVQVFVNESLQSLGWVDASWSDPNGRPVPYICSLLSAVLKPHGGCRPATQLLHFGHAVQPVANLAPV